MKNRHVTIMVSITCLFAAFTLGFLAGRTTAPGDTIITQMPEPTKAVVAAAEASLPSPETTATATPPTEGTSIPEETSGLININTATLDQLDSLPGIGPVLAQRIIDYRQAHGPFTTVSQLTLVDGIGQKKLEAILDLVTIE